jgi:hypothetical protein
LRNAVFGLGIIASLIAELVLYGGDRQEIAVAFAFVQTVSFALVLALFPTAAEALVTKRFVRVAWMFGALGLWALFQLAPFPTGMAREGWAAVDASPAITLDKFATLVELVKLLGLGALFGLGAVVGRNGRRGEFAYAAFGAIGAAYAGWAILDFYLKGRLGGSGPSDGRLTASLLSPNVAAACLGVFAIHGWIGALRASRLDGAALFKGADGRTRLPRTAWRWIALMVLALWAVALTASRGGALSVLLGFGAATLATLERGPFRKARGESRQARFPIALPFIVAGVLLMASVGQIGDRLKDSSTGIADRAVHTHVYVTELGHLPWTGLGLGTFQRFNTVIANAAEAPRFWALGAMHNVYLQWLYEGGIPGAGLMFGCLAYVLVSILGMTRGLRSESAWIAAAAGASALFLIHGLVDFDLQVVGVAGLWAFVLGAGFGAAERAHGTLAGPELVAHQLKREAA